MSENEKKILCPNCNTEVSVSFKFCPHCGAEFKPVGPKEKDIAENTIICPSCNSEVSDSFKFCPNCGATMQEKILCPDCNTEVEGSFKFCPNCGIEFEEDSVEDDDKSIDDRLNISTNFRHLNPYYQKEFTKILNSKEVYKGKWNWAAFFFHILWALTKGLWALAAIGFIVSIFTYGVGGLVFCFVMGARGNYAYYNLYTKDKQISL